MSISKSGKFKTHRKREDLGQLVLPFVGKISSEPTIYYCRLCAGKMKLNRHMDPKEGKQCRELRRKLNEARTRVAWIEVRKQLKLT